VFKSRAERDTFLADVGIEEAQFINGTVLAEAVKNPVSYE